MSMLLPQVSDEALILNMPTPQLVRLVRRLTGWQFDEKSVAENIERIKTELKGN